MANAIALAENYAKILDAKYKKSSLTSLLEVKNSLTRNFSDAGTVQLMSIVTDGLGDYSRANGFTSGSTTATWTPYQLEVDRGQSFQVDAMDDAEAKKMVFIETAKQFMMQEVIPEIDAIRFARMASKGTTISAALADGDATMGAIDTAVLAMDDAEVPQENRVIFMSNSTYTLLKNASKITRQFDIDTNGQKVINREFEYFDDMMVIKVPKARFFNFITLHDGTAAFGFEKTVATGKDINFMIVHKPSVVAITRHVKVRIFDSNTNQDADADKYQYRIYHDLIVPTNKTAGIYTHTVA